MAIAQASVAVSPGQQYTVPVGSTATVGAVVIANESPYALRVNSGASTQWIVAQTADIVLCNSMGFSGTLTISTDNYLTNADSAPSFLIYLTTFAPGETIPGQYPAPLMRLASGSGGVANAIVNDGNSIGTNIIESTPAGSTQSYWLARNDGTLQVWALSNNVITEVINLTPGSSSVAASLALHLLETLGVLKIDGGAIVTDGNGNLTVGKSGFNSSGTTETFVLQIDQSRGGGLNVPTAIFQFGGNSGKDLNITLGGDPFAGVYESVQFYTVNNGTQSNNFGVGVQGGATNPASWIDQNGVLHASAPVQLNTGQQETGFWGIEGIASGASQAWGCGVNFKTVLTNVPTSLSLTSVAQFNCGSPLIFQNSVYGIHLHVNSTAAGNFYWQGHYTTAGNCLLAVDPGAATFDHHCDNPKCGHVSRGVAFSALFIERATLGAALSYICPVCGTAECFTTNLTSADEDDTTPQGSGQYATTRGAQAALIRQLMTALGLAVAP